MAGITPVNPVVSMWVELPLIETKQKKMAAENVRVRVQVAKNSVLQQMRKQLQACGIMPPTTLLCQPNTPTAHATP